MRPFSVGVLLFGGSVLAAAGCLPEQAAVQTDGVGLMQEWPAAADTFINAAFPDNNNGSSPSLYTGQNGMGGAMRALVRFEPPAGWQGRVTVSRVVLTMVTRGTGSGETTPPTAATASLQALTAAWQEGTGVGDGSGQNTVGQACGTAGATWNQPACAGGTAWSGGAVATAVSATASVPASLEAAVTWDSDAAGNAGMVADVQSWIDAPSANQGWRIASSTEGTNGLAQRFYAREAAAKGPALAVTATCNPDFAEADGGCAAGGSADGGTGASDAGSPAPGGDGGCSCGLSAAGGGPAGGAALLVLVALMQVVRRGRRS